MTIAEISFSRCSTIKKSEVQSEGRKQLNNKTSDDIENTAGDCRVNTTRRERDNASRPDLLVWRFLSQALSRGISSTCRNTKCAQLRRTNSVIALKLI
jgi:hypothetical protein